MTNTLFLTGTHPIGNPPKDAVFKMQSGGVLHHGEQSLKAVAVAHRVDIGNAVQSLAHQCRKEVIGVVVAKVFPCASAYRFCGEIFYPALFQVFVKLRVLRDIVAWQRFALGRIVVSVIRADMYWRSCSAGV